MVVELQRLNIPVRHVQGWLSAKFFTGEYREFPELVKKFGGYESVVAISTPEKLYINGTEAMSSTGIFSFSMPVEWIEELMNINTTMAASRGQESG